MNGKAFMNAVTNGQMDIIRLLLNILADTDSDYCVIGGLAVNAYAEPVVSLDLDEDRRKSKRQKDLADIMRLIEVNPHLESQLPAEIRRRLR